MPKKPLQQQLRIKSKFRERKKAILLALCGKGANTACDVAEDTLCDTVEDVTSDDGEDSTSEDIEDVTSDDTYEGTDPSIIMQVGDDMQSGTKVFLPTDVSECLEVLLDDDCSTDGSIANHVDVDPLSTDHMQYVESGATHDLSTRHMQKADGSSGAVEIFVSQDRNKFLQNVVTDKAICDSHDQRLTTANVKERDTEGAGSLVNTVSPLDVYRVLQGKLPAHTTTLLSKEGFHIVLCSRDKAKLAQRTLFVACAGGIELFVHGKLLPLTNPIYERLMAVPILRNRVETYVEGLIQCWFIIRQHEICIGVPDPKFRPLWDKESNGFVDLGVFHEVRYQETFRSHKCLYLVTMRSKHCHECSKLRNKLGARRSPTEAEEAPSKLKGHSYGSSSEMEAMIKEKSRTIHILQARIKRLEALVPIASVPKLF